MRYDIKRGALLIANIRPDQGSTLSRQIMGENVVKMTFSLPTYKEFNIGDTVTAYGNLYTLNKLPEWNKISSLEYQYTLEFQAESYELAKVQCLFLNPVNDLLEADFSLMGTASDFMALVLANANRVSSGWSLGAIDVTEYKNLTFSKENCLQVLSRLAEEFKTEFWIEGKVMHLTKLQAATGLTFEYGKGKGLYQLNRSNTQDNIVTRLYAFGSDKNLAGNYRNYSDRLRLPVATGAYIEKDVSKYGVIEATMNFDDIYPHRTGTVTAVDGHLSIFDSALDFDINAQLIPGTTAKITFNTGQLAGYTFELNQYNNANKRITYNVNKEEKAIEVPSPTLKAAIGDTYVLTGIIMPDSYIADAEAELLATAQAYLNENSVPKVKYGLTLDPIDARRKAIVISLGNTVTVVDTPMSVNKTIRVVSLIRALDNSFDYQVDLAEVVTISSIVREISRKEAIEKAIEAVKASIKNGALYTQDKIAIANATVLQSAANDAYQKAEAARIAAEAAAGTDASAKANQAYNDAINEAELQRLSFAATLGDMSYLDVVEVSKLGTTVMIGGYLKNTLLDAVYIKANIINADYIQTINLNADKITAGKLQSANGQNYFDLINNTFKVGNGTSYMDWGVTTPGQLTIKGHIVADSGTIGNVNINAGDLFSLNGSKVQILPNAGLSSQGYANFTGTLNIPLITPASPAPGHIWAVDAVASGSAPVNHSTLYSLEDVAIGSQANGQALVWNSAAGKWVAGTVSAGSVDLSAYYTKTDSDGRFASLTGYNSSNWNAAYGWGNHASAGYSTAANVQTFTNKTWNGGSIADAYISSAATWNAKQNALGFTPYNATNPAGYITSSALSPYQLASGLGSNAYSSTAYLPLTGGTLTGDLTARQVTVSSGYGLNVADWQIGGTTGSRFFIYSNPLGLDVISISATTWNITFNKPLTGTSATFSTALTIPTVAPASIVAGSLWAVAV